jgi:SAM-dependent methyltransferase
MALLDLMRSLPRAKRNLAARSEAQTPENVALARRFGREYFDGSRATGYGGYVYDGRWIPVADDIIQHFGLGPGARILDVGCAKGFLVKDLRARQPGLLAVGLDVSDYALRHAEPEAAPFLVRGTCEALPFPDDSFDAVIAKDVIHNQSRAGCVRALREIERLAPGRGFVQVDAYRNEAEREIVFRWVLTARTICDPDGWREIFAEAGYRGAYYWTIIE